MGRPLNKKYFGNRNVGSASTTADDNLGGNRVASVTLGTLGSYTTRPTVTFSLPDLTSLGAVRATGTVTSEALSATVSAGGSGFAVGDLLNVTTAGGSAIAYVASVDAGNSDAILTVNFTGTGASRGSFESLGAVTTTVNTSTAGTGTLTLAVTWRAKAVVMTEKGSGYTDAADAAPTFTQSVTGTSVVEADGQANASDNPAGTNENAIVAYAYVPTANGGTQRLVADILRQVSTDRYKVRTSEGTGVCKLVTDGQADASGEMDITAYDTAGAGAGEYWVKKLCSRTVTLVAKGGGIGGSDFTNGKKVKWGFGSATAPSGADIGTAVIQNT